MRICIATSTRADWGLLSPLAHALKLRKDVKLDILATNMHLLERYGMTVDEIIADGFNVSARVPIDCTMPGEKARVKAMAACMDGAADALASMRPDLTIILGDRFEMLAIASAAEVMRIPIVHIAGGEISEGAIDDSIRHAISKLSSLHLTATEEYRRRVIQMGENPARVINTGALGVWNIMHRQLMDHAQLTSSLGFDFTPGRMILATYHPVTLQEQDCSANHQTNSLDCTHEHNLRINEMLGALDRFPDYKLIVTYPNNDAGSEEIISELESWADPSRTLLIKSLGAQRYLSALQFASVVVGNSSSGIVEVPSMGIPTVDIGIRQRGRISAPSVIHCGDNEKEIADAIHFALGSKMQQIAAKRENPYYKADTVDIMVKAITGMDPGTLLPKSFYDLE